MQARYPIDRAGWRAFLVDPKGGLMTGLNSALTGLTTTITTNATGVATSFGDGPQARGWEGGPVVKLMTEVEFRALGDGRIEAVVSTESEDRDGDIIRQAGWVLDSFQRHPVLLADHNYYSIRAQIGEWEGMAVKGKSLRGVARYYVGEGNPDADWAYQLAVKGRAAYSVGFIPKDYADRKDGGYEFTRQELLEVSHVTVPSNPDALQMMAKRAALISRALVEGSEVKVGRVLSAANESVLRSVVDTLDGTADAIEKVLEQLDKQDETQTDAIDLHDIIAAALRDGVRAGFKEVLE